MKNEYAGFESRKQDHIKLALDPKNQASEMNALDHLYLMHEALPDMDFEEISLAVHRFGQAVDKPLFVSSMTAGHAESARINRHLIAACEETGWAMGVGSQRRELTDPKAAMEWTTLRNEFPNAVLWGNLGISQLITTPLSGIERLIDALTASAFIVHCNPLQEAIQPEGTPQFKNCWNALAKLIEQLPVPVVVKETGCGFSSKTLSRLNEIGVAAVDISGLGGTHWGRVEGSRAPKNSLHAHASVTFHHWGINTVNSVQSAMRLNPTYEVWGSGGVRHGLDAAKLLALGVSSVGFGKSMLESALKGTDDVIQVMLQIEYELKIAMFCTGSMTPNDLKGKLVP